MGLLSCLAFSTAKRPWVVGIGVAGALALLVLYAQFDPAAHFFPKCVFKSFTGLSCPGCGSQRALHALLTGHPMDAFFFNPLLLVGIPLLLLMAASSIWPKLWMLKITHWPYLGTIVLVLVITYTVVRNIFGF